MKKSLYKVTAAFAFGIFAMNVYADQGSGGKGMGMGGNSAEATTMSDGEIKDVNKANNSIILKHGPIDNMHMGPMTMAFAVKSASLLSKVKVGDKVKFRVENVNDVATVTSLVVQK